MKNLNDLPENAVKLFDLYVQDAGNWSGTPLVGCNVTLLGEREDRGLLTFLKRAGLVKTWVDEGCTWLRITTEGRAFAVARGLDVTALDWAL